MAEKEVNPKGSKIAENTVSLAASGAGSLVLTLVQLSILSRFLGGSLFGLFAALRGFSLLLSTIVLIGLPQVLIRFLPSYQSRGRWGRAIGLFICSALVVLVLGCILYATSDLWRGWMPERIGGLSLSDEVTMWMVLASVAVAVKMLLYGGFNGLREMRMQMILELVYMLALTLFIVALRASLDIALLFKAICFFNAAVFVTGFPIFIRLVYRLIARGGGPGIEGIVLPAIFPYWAGSVLISFVALAFTDVDRFIISSFLPASVVSLFHVASRVNFLLKRFLGIPVIAAQPEVTRIYEDGRRAGLPSKIALFTKGSFVASLFVTGLAAVIGKDVIVTLSGPVYAEAYPILLVLLPTIPIAAVIAPLLMTMRSLHYIRWAVLCDFLWMAVYFGTFFIFISLWGVLGMAVAQVAASTVQMIAAIGLSKREGFYGGVGARLGRVFLSFVVIVPVGILATWQFGITASIICLVLSPFAARALLTWLKVFEPEEKKQIKDLIPMAVGRRTVSWILSSGV